MAKVRGHEIAKSRAAGMAAATRGRSRRFADKADLLEQARSADADADIKAGVEEFRETRRCTACGWQEKWCETCQRYSCRSCSEYGTCQCG